MEEIGELDPDLEKTLKNRYFTQKITRLQALKNQIDLRVKALGAAQSFKTLEHLKATYRESYYRSVYDMTMSGIVADFDILNDNLVEKVVRTKWLHESFDERIGKQQVDADSRYLIQMIELTRKGIGNTEDIGSALLRLQRSSDHYGKCLWEKYERMDGVLWQDPRN